MKREATAVASAARRTRRRYSVQFRREVVEQTLAPGVSIAAIALEHRLNTNLVFKWRRDHLRELAGAIDAPKMLPVTIGEAPGKGAGGTRTVGVIEIELAAGRIRLKGPVDADSLRTVLELMSRR
jgi:transposase